MSKTEQDKVGKFIEEYLSKRTQISLIVFLVDIRHKPTDNDKIMYNYIISSKIPFIILANKADKLAKTKVADATLVLQKELNPIGDIPTFPFSSERKVYTDNVWEFLESYIEQKRTFLNFTIFFSILKSASLFVCQFKIAVRNKVKFTDILWLY